MPSTDTWALASSDGHMRRAPSAFRDFVSRDPNSKYPAEKGRYVLYMNYGCPWAHRTLITRQLKGLEDVIELIPTDVDLTKEGWRFTGKNGSLEKEPIFGHKGLKEVYLEVEPEYTGRYTVPTLFDKKTKTIVSNESSEIIRMFYEEFDEFIPEELRETSKEGGKAGFYPEHLRKEIDEMNEWVYDKINNGVYKCGFASTQEAYDANIGPLFESLDRLEKHLSKSEQPFLFGKHITEADIRLFPTIVRFDVAYHTCFLCNLKSIRHDYPNLNLWLRRLYWDDTKLTRGAFRDTVNFWAYKYGYMSARTRALARASQVSETDAKEIIIVPAGPGVNVEALKEGEKLK